MSDAYRVNRRRIFFAVAAVILLVAAAFLVLANIYAGDTIRKGISIEQTDVSWMSAQDAEMLVSHNIMRQYGADKVALVYGNRTWDVPLEDIDYSYMVENAVQQAYYIGRGGSIFQQVINSILLTRNGQHLDVEETYDRYKLKAILEKIKKECDSTGKNAEISYNNGKITFKRDRPFRNLDIDRNMELIENQLMRRKFDNIELLVEERQAKITYDELKVINGIVSNYSTQFNRGDINRTDNIKLACSRINNKLLMPGDVFSMNSALGPRTHANGYKEAPIIFKNELVPGTGGGVCQVSSTLYNTVLLAGLDVIEREQHSLTLSYISPGRDATITEDSIDFRFVNNLDYPVYLQASVSGNRLNISMLGKKSEDGLVYKLKTETTGVYQPKPDIIQLDHTLQYGQKKIERRSKKGLRVVLYREAYRNGELQWRQRLTEDYYKPVQGIVKVSSDLYQLYQASDEAGRQQ